MIPPTRSVLVQNVNSLTYRGVGGHVWGQILLPSLDHNHQPRGALPQLMTASINHSGQLFPRQLKYVKNWCSANAGRDI